MWLGVAAGLALLTWFTVCPAVLATQITFGDQRLNYNGEGWQNTQSPQVCQQVSSTMRSTSTLGDSVNFTFSGNVVYYMVLKKGYSLPRRNRCYSLGTSDFEFTPRSDRPRRCNTTPCGTSRVHRRLWYHIRKWGSHEHFAHDRGSAPPSKRHSHPEHLWYHVS